MSECPLYLMRREAQERGLRFADVQAAYWVVKEDERGKRRRDRNGAPSQRDPGTRSRQTTWLSHGSGRCEITVTPEGGSRAEPRRRRGERSGGLTAPHCASLRLTAPNSPPRKNLSEANPGIPSSPRLCVSARGPLPPSPYGLYGPVFSVHAVLAWQSAGGSS